MDKIFIGWSGNKSLADKLAQLIDGTKRMQAIVGGGQPKDMFVGAQVLNQIHQCNYAILLVEDKEGSISPNLMFEWGYLMAKMSVHNIHTYLINKSSRDLPSDLLGSWVDEIWVDREKENDEQIAASIYDVFKENVKSKSSINYFDLVSNWKQVYVWLTDDKPDTVQELCEYIIFGCLAAYYYMDNHGLRRVLDTLNCKSEEENEVVRFAKAYIDVFLDSENMTKPLTYDQFFRAMQEFETTLDRKRYLTDELDRFLDILCYDVYGLACVLFIRNADIDEETRNHCALKAKECFEKDLELLRAFEAEYDNKCLGNLIYAYIYNDTAHLFRDAFGDNESYNKYLALSVNERKRLWQQFMTYYPHNVFLATKLEQEYVVALSEQCNNMEESFLKTMTKNTILKRFREWEKELVFSSTLTYRIKENLKQLTDEI